MADPRTGHRETEPTAADHAAAEGPVVVSAYTGAHHVVPVWVYVAVYLALVFQTTPVNWARVWEGIPRGVNFVLAFFPPDFLSRHEEIIEGIAESLWMTVVKVQQTHAATAYQLARDRASARSGSSAEAPGRRPTQ